MKILYFAWLRERVGTGEEDVTPPPEIATVAELMAWLAGKGEHYAYAFENPKVVRAAVDHEHVKHSAPIAGAREVAFFPPMTGG
jgi:sulfur-carrier protein